MKDYSIFYQNLTEPLRRRPRWLQAIKFFNRLMTLLMPLVYVGVLLGAFWTRSWLGLLVYLLLPAAGFVLLSLVRKKINHPRPYESWAISPLLAKDVSGKSLPSRHVFSSALVATAALTLWPWLGLVLLVLTGLLALVRVLGGVHYPRDVVIGYACGLLVGGLLYLF